MWLRKCSVEIALLVASVGTSFFTQHIDVPLVWHYFSEVKRFLQVSRLLRVPFSGAPRAVTPWLGLQFELLYFNHPSSALNAGTIRAKIGRDVMNVRVFVFERSSAADILGLRVFPL